MSLMVTVEESGGGGGHDRGADSGLTHHAQSRRSTLIRMATHPWWGMCILHHFKEWCKIMRYIILKQQIIWNSTKKGKKGRNAWERTLSSSRLLAEITEPPSRYFVLLFTFLLFYRMSFSFHLNCLACVHNIVCYYRIKPLPSRAELYRK